MNQQVIERAARTYPIEQLIEGTAQESQKKRCLFENLDMREAADATSRKSKQHPRTVVSTRLDPSPFQPLNLIGLTLIQKHTNKESL